MMYGTSLQLLLFVIMTLQPSSDLPHDALDLPVPASRRHLCQRQVHHQLCALPFIADASLRRIDGTLPLFSLWHSRAMVNTSCLVQTQIPSGCEI
ncbi:hypothetical protein EDB19DRAFT_1736270 [Suillus lakei]|nr:hypothetical protein EDB19DRAFT_1762995 [Suillus lakei]KAG1731953.1 hypothetical protein EDB19DRAFT_1736270 [Suillus lakei]